LIFGRRAPSALRKFACTTGKLKATYRLTPAFPARAEQTGQLRFSVLFATTSGQSLIPVLLKAPVANNAHAAANLYWREARDLPPFGVG
jgi:hypothetical protein